MNPHHKKVLAAFRAINPAGILSAAILDQKSEKFVTVALASVLNAKARVARTEYKLVDLVLTKRWSPGIGEKTHDLEVLAEYQAKCAYLNDFRDHHRDLKSPTTFAEPPSKDAAWWLGACLKHDLTKASWARRSAEPGVEARGGLFYLLDVEPPIHQAKYSEKKGARLDLGAAKEVVEKLVGRNAKGWATAKPHTTRERVRVQVHLGLFDLGR